MPGSPELSVLYTIHSAPGSGAAAVAVGGNGVSVGVGVGGTGVGGTGVGVGGFGVGVGSIGVDVAVGSGGADMGVAQLESESSPITKIVPTIFFILNLLSTTMRFCHSEERSKPALSEAEGKNLVVCG